MTSDLFFFLIDDVRVVVVSSGDDGMSSQDIHGSERSGVLVVLHEPTGGLGTKPNAAGENKGRDEGGTQLETPSDSTRVFHNDIGCEAQKDT